MVSENGEALIGFPNVLYVVSNAKLLQEARLIQELLFRFAVKGRFYISDYLVEPVVALDVIFADAKLDI